MRVRIKKLRPTAEMPAYATIGAACFDLVAAEAGSVLARGALTVGTGLSIEVPPGHAMLVFSRSGHGFQHGVRLANCAGVIDSDYRGEVKIRLHNDSDRALGVDAGDRIAQAMIVAAPLVEFVTADTLAATDRGDAGFGSTGR